MAGRPSTSTSPSQSPSPSNRPDRETAPVGIDIVCLIGCLGAFLSLLVGFGLFTAGGVATLVGLALLLVSVAQLGVYVGLWMLAGWAWKWALILEGTSIVLDLYQTDAIGLLIGLVVFSYVLSKGDLYE